LNLRCKFRLTQCLLIIAGMLAQFVLTDPMEALQLPAVLAVLVEENVLVKHGAASAPTAVGLSPRGVNAPTPETTGAGEAQVLPGWCSTELDPADSQVYRISSLLLQKALLELLLSDEKQTKKFTERLQGLPAKKYYHLRTHVIATLLGKDQ
jgi:hypothetical protein